MKEMGVPGQFVKWIMVYMSIVSYMYSINGHYRKLSKARRGLIQGNPISLILFIMTMEYMHMCLAQLKSQSEFDFHPKCERLLIKKIFFAVDFMIFTRCDETFVRMMMEKFHEFS